MLRIFLIAALAMFAMPAVAQTAVTRNCVTAACTLVMDVTADATGCRAFLGGVQYAEVARAGTTCTFPARNFTAGVHVLTAKAYNAGGESPFSAALTLTSAVPPPPAPAAPTNLRFQ